MAQKQHPDVLQRNAPVDKYERLYRKRRDRQHQHRHQRGRQFSKHHVTRLHRGRQHQFQRLAFPLAADTAGSQRRHDEKHQSLAEIQPLSEREFRALGTGKPGEGVIVWNKKVVLFNARIEKDNILYEKYSTNFHEKAQRKERDSARSTSPVRKENVTKSEEEPERWEERVPLQVAYKPEPEMPQNWQEEKPDVLQQGWGEQEWETVLQLAAFAPIRLGDVTALLEIAPEEAQRLLDTMLQAGVLEEKEGWYRIVE